MTDTPLASRQPPTESQEPLSIRAYRALSAAAVPVADYALRRRLGAAKEDAVRIGERRGQSLVPRPEGVVIWLHGASVGESLSVLPLLDRLQAMHPDWRFLVTTGTVTSARLMAERLPDGAIHQYIPLDHPRYVESFLDHWRPDAALFVESEFWPNLILQSRKRVGLLALINGRVSPNSFRDWSRQPRAIRYLLSTFDILIAQDKDNALRLTELAGQDVCTFGNLKYAAPALPVSARDLDAMRAAIGGRPVWLAASTHPGEEDFVFDATRDIKMGADAPLTILAPRHPDRGGAVAACAAEHGLVAARRSRKDAITPHTDVYVADTLGELGLFYRLSDISFVGGSLIEKGGHNPLEPARLGGAILHGPHTFNFSDTYAQMRAAGGSALVRNERDLAAAIRRLVADEKTRLAMAAAARACVEKSAEQVLAQTVALIVARFYGATRAA